MKEIRDIVRAFDKAVIEKKACALATVVHVEGSSYRRPGARMLVTDDGILTGAISGGCLEGDALRKALLAIAAGENKLVTYNTMDEDDVKLGIQLGCNGIVHILFEPIKADIEDGPMAFLKNLIKQRDDAALITIFSLTNKHQIGTCFLSDPIENETTISTYFKLGQLYKTQIKNLVKDVFINTQSIITALEQDKNENLVFVQFIPPPVSLIIVGAGNDAMPLVNIAQLLGWDITIIDGRITHATKRRFEYANNIIISKAENILDKIIIDSTTVCVLMTHNYNYDIEVLKKMFDKGLIYLGLLGPKLKMERMYNDLKEEGIEVSNKQRESIYSPVGLDIGAETSEEIALSIVAEIKSVVSKKNAQMLRNKVAAIHD